MLSRRHTNAGKTAAELGYRMPAEWEPHACTWLAWPHNRESWPGNFEPIPAVWQTLVVALAEFEPVHILAGGDDVMAEASDYVGQVPSVTLHDIPTNDAWIRDHGPTFLVGTGDQPAALVDWQYNAWGGKYPPFDDDNRVGGRIATLLGRRVFEPGIVLEGGAIDTNGRGTLLSTTQCLLNPNRNPGLDQADMEQSLRDHLGARKVLWLDSGMAGDDTDGHVDQMARFVNPRTVVAAVEQDRSDVNYAPLQENWRRLQTMSDQDDRPLEVIALPMPAPVEYGQTRLPASYLNFYIANGVVIVPEFGDPADRVATDILGRVFPDRTIRGLAARELVWGLGAYHCITQQQPVARSARVSSPSGQADESA